MGYVCLFGMRVTAVVHAEHCLALNVADYAAGISGCNNSRRDVLRDNASSADNGIVADGYAREYAYAAAYPYVVSNSDGVGIFQSLVTQFGIEGMACSVEAAVGAYKYVVAKGYGSCVENDTVEVGKKVMPYFNVVAMSQ